MAMHEKESKELQALADRLRYDAANQMKKALAESAHRASAVLSNSLDSSDEKVALDAAKTYAKLLGLEAQKIELSGKLTFEPIRFVSDLDADDTQNDESNE